MSNKSKEFRDPVHGYITVPADFCSKIIDTPIFQRLREIEQTGIRVLFPGARHCRFSHSLGTYHLGCKAFHHFKANAQGSFENISQDQWEGYKATFSLACLLHDCAHAPFSHTFEKYYALDKATDEGSRLLAPLLAAADDEAFERDYTDDAPERPSAHEEASAVILLRHFKPAVQDLNGAPLLACRMILGCRHLGDTTDEQKLENCLIDLLNSRAIDVDKLDYIMRDTWASGVDNTSIDIHRLLSALTFEPGHTHVVFKKSALSVLQSVVDARNYLFRWVFSHHKVVYNQYLLRTAVERLAESLPPGNKDAFFSELFSLDTFEKDVQVCEGHSVHLPTDHDLTVLLKKHRESIPEAKEYLSRQHSRRPLWKTWVEFKHIFTGKGLPYRLYIKKHAGDILSGIPGCTAAADSFVVEDIPQKFVIMPEEIKVQFDGGCHSYESLIGTPEASELKHPFYIFAPDDCMDRRDDFIKALQSQSV